MYCMVHLMAIILQQSLPRRELWQFLQNIQIFFGRKENVVMGIARAGTEICKALQRWEED